MDRSNPIEIAAKVLTSSDHCFFVGRGANRFADKHGFPVLPKDSLKTPYAIYAYEKYKSTGEEEFLLPVRDSKGTCGAVALDLQGNLAAGTSTGGISAKEEGRVGDTPIVGGGFYADNETGKYNCATDMRGRTFQWSF